MSRFSKKRKKRCDSERYPNCQFAIITRACTLRVRDTNKVATDKVVPRQAEMALRLHTHGGEGGIVKVHICAR